MEIEIAINREQEKIAFSLGGLAGNNAWGAGFLQAALDYQIKPDFIACTSGQISWVLHYLNVLKQGGNLGELLEEEMKGAAPYPYKDLNWMNLMTFGLKDVYKPVSFPGYMAETSINMMNSFNKITQQVLEKNFKNVSFFETIQSWKPARTLKPARTEEQFEEISNVFNQADIGIAFNAFLPKEGVEHVYLNDKARDALGVQGRGRKHPYRERTYYYDITAGNVYDALWLYQYGFPEDINSIDGAYYRQIILSELVAADHIFVARPVNHKWLTEWPIDDITSQDLQTMLLFNGSYSGERDKIELINKLLKDGDISDKGKQTYHHIHLHELEIPTYEGFFDFVFEKRSVFDNARDMASKKFKRLGMVS